MRAHVVRVERKGQWWRVHLYPVRPELVEGLSFCSPRFMPFWTYMLHCNGGALYVGHTDDLERRVTQHIAGSVPGFTADRWPVKLIWSEYFSTRGEALEMEQRIKGWSRAKKLALVRGDWDRISLLARKKEKARASTGSARTDQGMDRGA